MLKRVKSVSMLLTLVGFASTGVAYANEISGAVSSNTTQQQETCSGVVKDASGETIIGASVIVKGTTNGTITSIDGDFVLSNVKKGDIIQISFVGYQTAEVTFKGKPITVTLMDDTQTLDEVVQIQAEGKEKRRQAEVELVRIENDLKNRLLQMRGE